MFENAAVAHDERSAWFPQYKRGSVATAAGRGVASRERRSTDAFDSRIYTPPGWPEGVLPPGAPDWEKSAVAFLLDCCPADYRAYPVLRRHPIILVRFAAEFVEGQLRASREGLGDIRSSLVGLADAHAVEAAVDAWQCETARLVRVRRSVALVEEALRGRVFIRKL